MKFTFDYREVLERRVVVDAEDLGDAIKQMHRRIDSEDIVLDSEDFMRGQLTMPLEQNFLPQLEKYGESISGDGLDLLIDFW